jgi:hypothetical protein
MILSSQEIQELTIKFLSKHSKKLECKLYPFEEKVFKQGEIINNIYIVKEGVFKIGKVDTPEFTNSLGFCFKDYILAPFGVFAPGIGALFELKSIENNLTKCNSMYEISLEQWKLFTEEDEMLTQTPASAFCNNFTEGIVFLAMLRKNRNAESIYSNMYDANHPILNSGIANKYVAEFLGVTPNTLKQFANNKRLNIKKKK